MALLTRPTNAILCICKPSKKLGLDPASSYPANQATPAVTKTTITALASWHARTRLEAIETLVELMRYDKDERVRGTAAQALLDRGWGKAKVDVASNGEN